MSMPLSYYTTPRLRLQKTRLQHDQLSTTIARSKRGLSTDRRYVTHQRKRMATSAVGHSIDAYLELVHFALPIQQTFW